jgi:glycine cleavage system H protein
MYLSDKKMEAMCMPKRQNVKVEQELLEEVESEIKKEEQYGTLSEFVSDAIRLRLESITKETVSEYLERDKTSTVAQLQGQLLYTPTHVWAQLTSEGTVKLGVTHYFPSQLKGIVYVETEKAGTQVSTDKPVGTVETAAGWPFVIHDVYSPVEGKILNVNKEVLDDPYLLNGNAYQWIIEIEPQNPEELQRLLHHEEYGKLLQKLEGRPRVPLSESELSQLVAEIRS